MRTYTYNQQHTEQWLEIQTRHFALHAVKPQAMEEASESRS